MTITTSDSSYDLETRGEPGETPGEPDTQQGLFRRLQRWAVEDLRHSAEWRSDAKDNYEMAAGRQWDSAEEQAFHNQGKVPIKFNRILSIVKSVAGHEINNRHELRYFPRGVEDTAANDLLNAVSAWMGDVSDAEDEESDAFEDVAICGMGWTEHLMEYDQDVEGLYTETRTDPLEMAWDKSAKRKNLVDARRIHRIKKDIDIDEARRMFPGIPDISLNATWVTGETDRSDPVPIEIRREHEGDSDLTSESWYTNTVTIVETQWYDLEPYYMVAGPGDSQPMEMDAAQYAVFEERANMIGFPYQAAKLQRRVYKRAFLGATGILDMSVSPAGDNFTYTCITGDRDRNNNVWFGLVSVMHDPQKFANKFLTNTLHLLNVTAKGGVMAEYDAFEDPRQAENSWANPQDITWLKDGAISGQNPKVLPKPVSQFPVGYWQMMDFAISSIRDTSGVNLELLGMVDRNQPGILEAQRKQAGMTILATLFNNLRRFRKAVGRIRLEYIQRYMSDGRLIRINGPMGAKAVPLLKDKTLGRYDVVVDESGSSINQKELTWNMIVQVLPIIRDMLTPQIFFSLLKYSPLPESLLTELQQMMEQGQNDPAAEQQQKLLMHQLIAKIERDKAASQKDQTASVKNQADAQKTMAEIGKTTADIEKTSADTQKIKAEIEQLGSIADPAVQNIFKLGLDAQQAANPSHA